MFKKIAGLFLAAAVMCSSAAITASAAEAEDDAAVAAADQSGEVSADGSSEVSADASSEVEAGNVVKFDVKKSGWNNVKTVFCHIWRADGSGDWPAWQSKKEKCKYDASTGIATYDLSMTGNTISKSDGRVYCASVTHFIAQVISLKTLRIQKRRQTKLNGKTIQTAVLKRRLHQQVTSSVLLSLRANQM